METKEIFQHMAMPDLSTSCIALCTLGLQEHEFQTYMILINKGPMSVNDLKVLIKKSRASAQRIVSQLLSKGLVYRKKKTFLDGGYLYQYHSVPLETLKEKMKISLKQWFERSIAVIEDMKTD